MVAVECVGGPWDGRVIAFPEAPSEMTVTWFSAPAPMVHHTLGPLQRPELREGRYTLQGADLVWQGER